MSVTSQKRNSGHNRIAHQVLRVARVVGVAHEGPDPGPGRCHVAAAHLDVGRQVVFDLVQDELEGDSKEKKINLSFTV